MSQTIRNVKESFLNNTYVVDLGDRKDIAVLEDTCSTCTDESRYRSLITGELYV